MDKAKRSKGGAKRKRKGSSKYERGAVNRVKGVQDKKLRAAIEAQEGHFEEAAQSAAAAEVLLPAEAGYLEAEGMERTFKFKQRAIQEHVDIATKRSAVDLRLPEFGPYALGNVATWYLDPSCAVDTGGGLDSLPFHTAGFGATSFGCTSAWISVVL